MNDPRLHLGLWPADKVDLEIRWRNGGKEQIANIPANRIVTIREGAGIIKADLAIIKSVGAMFRFPN